MLGLSIHDQLHWAVVGDAVRIPARQAIGFTIDTRSDIGSVTKIIATTAALMQLVDRHDVRLTDGVESILGLGLNEAITVADLLQHQAGLWEWWPLYLNCTDAEAALTLIGTLPPRYRYRSGRHYSDLGFMLLGAVIEKLTGERLDRACQELIFTPYALSATSFSTPVPGAPVAASSPGDRIEQTMIESGRPYPVDGRAQDFTGWREDWLIGQVNDGNSFHVFSSCAGHAGVFSTAGDLLRFGQLIMESLSGTGPVSQRTAEVFCSTGRAEGQGLGWRIWQTAAGPAIGHTGFPGVGLAILPERGAVLSMVTNRLHVPGTPRPLEELWLTALHGAVDLLPS